MSVEFIWHGARIEKKMIGNRDRALLAAALAFQGQARLIVPKVTHNLERSIIPSGIINAAIYVGTNVSYAPHVEYGTRYFSPRAFFRKSIDVMRQPLNTIFKQYIGQL